MDPILTCEWCGEPVDLERGVVVIFAGLLFHGPCLVEMSRIKVVKTNTGLGFTHAGEEEV